MATYRALTDLYLASGVYVQAGTTFSDSGPGALIPTNWQPPTNAVDPIDPDAVQRYWQVGPRGMSDAEPYRAVFTNSARWLDVAVPAPATYWIRANPQNAAAGFVLNGMGSNYGVHPQV